MSYLILDEMYFTPDEISMILGISPPTVRKLVRLGRIASIRIGSKVLISKDGLRSYFYSLNIQRFDEKFKDVEGALRKVRSKRHCGN